MYQGYKAARDAAWKALIGANIGTLPVRLSDIAIHYNINIINYNDAKISPNNEDGFCTCYNGRNIIFYNNQKLLTRARFTIAHELGHCLLGHLTEGQFTNRTNNEADIYGDLHEVQANVFARDLLMPATVLHGLNVSSPKDIARICKVSAQSAEIRYRRLLELNRRGMYNRHPLERQVFEQFKDFIDENKL